MAYYLVQAAYTADTWATLIKNPQNRLEALRPVIERFGGTIEGFWYAFGEYDAVGIIQMPDNAKAAALSIAAAASGALKAFKTTPLMTIEEGIDAMRQAGGLGYRPPSAS